MHISICAHLFEAVLAEVFPYVPPIEHNPPDHEVCQNREPVVRSTDDGRTECGHTTPKEIQAPTEIIPPLYSVERAVAEMRSHQ